MMKKIEIKILTQFIGQNEKYHQLKKKSIRRRKKTVVDYNKDINSKNNLNKLYFILKSIK